MSANPSPWPIGLSTGCFYKRSIFDILDDVRKSDFRTIEVCSFPAHLDYHNSDAVQRAGDQMRDLGLRPYSFHAPFADHIDITSFNPQIREAAVQELLVASRAAARMNVEHLVLHPGPERAGKPPSHEFLEHVHFAAEALNRVAAECCRLNVQLLLENMLPHLLFGHIGDMMHLLGSIHECAMGVCVDTGHALLAGELGNVIPKFSGHLKMLHVNDNRRNYDSHLPPGEGDIDWGWLLYELKVHHFQGALILELAGHEGEPIPETMARAQRARDYLISKLPPFETVAAAA